MQKDMCVNETGGLRIALCVTGGIAAYKAVQVVRDLTLLGHTVDVIMTHSAEKFVGKATFEAISHRRVLTSVFEEIPEVSHVAIGQRADVVAVVPCTANTMAAIATGLAGDLVTTTVLASRAPLVLAPAMHTEMWENQATQANVALLRERGVRFAGPAAGRLTGSDAGIGRLAEPSDIVSAILQAARVQDLAGKKIVITAGGTREKIDPVRFIGNKSSGKQGVALAEAARDRGADVTLIAANLEIPAPFGVRVVAVESALQMRDAVQNVVADADAMIMAAAVADFRAFAISESKIKKTSNSDVPEIKLVQNPDILAELGSNSDRKYALIGFAAETESDRDARLDIARTKLSRKGADFLVVNQVGDDIAFGSDNNAVDILDKTGKNPVSASGTKAVIANKVLDLLIV